MIVSHHISNELAQQRVAELHRAADAPARPRIAFQRIHWVHRARRRRAALAFVIRGER